MDNLSNLWSNATSAPFLVQAEDGTIVLVQYKLSSRFFGIVLTTYVHGYQASGLSVILDGNEVTWVAI